MGKIFYFLIFSMTSVKGDLNADTAWKQVCGQWASADDRCHYAKIAL